MKLKRKGFTLIELLVVIAIIAILAAVAIIQFQGAQADARDARRQADLRAMQSALELYLNENPTGYPAVDGETATITWSTIMGELNTYLPSTIEDPTGGNIYYCGGGASYILQTSLEGTTAVSGDIDDDSGWTTEECEASPDIAVGDPDTAGALLDCEDTVDVDFCLGSTTP